MQIQTHEEDLATQQDSRGQASFTHGLICRFDKEKSSIRLDSVIEEVVYATTLNGVPYRDMTCSPWDVRELVIGGLFTSGRIDRFDQILNLEIDEEAGTVTVETTDDAGAAGLVVDRVLCPEASRDRPIEPMLTAQEVSERIEYLEGGSELFHRTGGVHSAVMVDRDGALVAWFEDIGRHNALDKLAGWCVMNGADASDKILLFSGRVPREIIARAIRIGFPVVISPGAPTNLSIQLACEHGVTLIGFAKNGKFNVYTHTARIR